ncbi:MAG: 23S rRNA (pseudouridine(1915)-N(3))-methyltransferase RlmH [Alphaproteobacteria bacterium]|nr:23S rRNA (pseudouridine(1915)-N(3))-methyltransferase RlmH [Alphaproteobacteria bacterium]MBQ3117048.1 23S rRNA (pseudouridine(1915)-N(3))-methyltransferase RlmH [Alphaproteobacteria bacterium]MBQ8557867.1 23S rRNA (pseudouridine(1915)-N(3))-methyltransferase RlmH [Alphaproteobacteria bacterium]
MNIIITAIGKLKKQSPENILIQEYIRKTRWNITIKELEEKKALSGLALKEAESHLLLSAIPSDAKIVVLDETGKTPSSREFADKIRQWQNAGESTIAFLIGGADGHADFLKQRADYKLSFGRMTLPHMLARVVLSEQIYRAKTIIDGHPYHRD